MTVHYATRDITACGNHIYGHTAYYYENGSESGDIENVNHTTVLENVTCTACRGSTQYQSDLIRQRKESKKSTS